MDNNLLSAKPATTDTIKVPTTPMTVMYILLNTTLKMGKGKIAAQCCHGACRVVRLLERYGGVKSVPRYYQDWYDYGETKVVLKVDESMMRDIYKNYCFKPSSRKEDLWCVSVNDAGRTQIAPGSLTVLAFRPMLKDDAPECIKNLKLL